MPIKKWPDDIRESAIELYVAMGSPEAERITGVPRATIKSWARRAGVVPSTEELIAAVSASPVAPLPPKPASLAVADIEETRIEIADPDSRWGKALVRARSLTVEEKLRAAAERRAETEAAWVSTRQHLIERKSDLMRKLVEQAHSIVGYMSEEQIDYVGQQGREVVRAHPSAEALRAYATSIGIIVDKLRLELGESSHNAAVHLDMRGSVDLVAKQYGLDPEEVLLEAQRLLAGATAEENHE